MNRRTACHPVEAFDADSGALVADRVDRCADQHRSTEWAA
jgi:hypothetical protein